MAKDNPMSMTRKETLALASTIASCARRAADRSVNGWGRAPLEEIASIVTKQEKEHRSMGARMVGAAQVRAEYRGFPVSAAVDHFTARVLAAGLAMHKREAKVSELYGLRDDYVRGAILMSDKSFREAFAECLREAFPDREPEDVLMTAEGLDYQVAKGVRS